MARRERSAALRASAAWTWARLGDPAARSVVVALLYLPISLAGPLLVDRDRLSGGVGLWLLIGLAGELAVLVVFAGCRVVPGPRRSCRACVTLVVIVAALLARAAVIAWLPWQQGLTPQPEWGYRVAAALVTQVGLLVVLSLTVSAYAYHRALATELAGQRAELLEARRSLAERVTHLRAQLADEVHRTIDPLIAELDERLAKAARAGDATQAQGAVREVVDESLRPLSHRLTEPSALSPVVHSAPVARPGRLPLPSHVSVRQLIHPGTVGLLVALMAGSQGIRELSIGGAVMFTVAMGVGVALVLAVIRAPLGRWSPPTRLGIAVTMVVSSIALTGTLVTLRVIDWPVPEHIRLAAVVMGAVVGGIVAFYSVVTSRREVMESDLRASIEDLEVTLSALRQYEFVTRRELGVILHGSVQSALHAASMRLAAHPHPDDVLLAQIRSDIAQAIGRLDSPGSPDVLLVDTLSDIAELWNGTCAVRWTVDHRTVRLMVESPTASASVAEITRECVANAIRHGGATDVWITIGSTGDRIVVTALDNGTRITDWRPGLGTLLMDELCLAWTHEPAHPGTRLTAEVVMDRALG